MKPSRWHLTCEFLGECGPHEVDRQLGRWERRATRSHPLTLRLAGAGSFPAKAWMARVLWIGLDGDVEGWSALAAYGQDPHLTLARTRERQDVTGLVAELGSYAGPEWTADEVVVFESFLPGKGAAAAVERRTAAGPARARRPAEARATSRSPPSPSAAPDSSPARGLPRYRAVWLGTEANPGRCGWICLGSADPVARGQGARRVSRGRRGTSSRRTRRGRPRPADGRGGPPSRR